MFDANLMLRTTGDLTQDESVGPVTIYGGQRKGLAVRAIVPEGYGANDTVKMNVYTSSDGSTYNLVASSGAAVKPYGVGVELLVPFTPLPGKTYVKAELDVTVASTTPDFGVAVVGIVENTGFPPDRDASYQFR